MDQVLHREATKEREKIMMTKQKVVRWYSKGQN